MVQDATNQSLAAGAANSFNVSVGAISPGSWVNPVATQAYIIEALMWTVEAEDNSGKLQIEAIFPDGVEGINWQLAPMLVSWPFTFPAVTGVVIAAQAMTPLAPYSAITQQTGNNTPNLVTNGPTAWFILNNTDGSNAHVYKRGCSIIYRIVDGIDAGSGYEITGAVA
jgi:hypothetical protein